MNLDALAALAAVSAADDAQWWTADDMALALGREDAEFAAAADPATILSLIAEVRELRATVSRLSETRP